jgi:AAA domain
MPFATYEGLEPDDPPAGDETKANSKTDGQKAERPSSEPFEPIDFPSLAGREPPERRFAIKGWVPAGTVTSLYGAGGIGKSMLAQQMATCVATGVSAFGFRVEGPAPVAGVFTEDDNEELWRRQCRINDAVGLPMGNLRKLHLQGRAGLENTLVSYPSNKKPQAHPLAATIVAACERYRPGLLILDNIAQLFGGDENDRHQVSHFCNLIVGFARDFGCGVLLLGHPSKAEGSEYSGSTAWNAAVRSRLLLCRDKDGELRLMRPKANYAENDTLPLAWVAGVLRPITGDDLGPVEQAAKQQRDRHVEEVFLKALDRLAELKVIVSHSANAMNYAPKMMRRYNLVGDLTSDVLQDAMLRLIDRGEVLTEHPVEKKANRGWKKGMVRTSSVSGGQEQDRGADTADAEAPRGEDPDA